VSRASTGASLCRLVDCARHSAASSDGCWCSWLRKRGEMTARVRKVRTCWKGKKGAREEMGGDISVSGEHWCFPLLIGCARHSAKSSGNCRCNLCCRCLRAWRGGRLRVGSAHLLEGQGERSRGKECRRWCLLASTGASPSWSGARGTARQAMVVAGATTDAAGCARGALVACGRRVRTSQ
jgi:hypothetical protein